MTDKPTWRERFAKEIEAGKQEQQNRIENLDAEQLKYERRLKQFKEAKRLNRFIPSQPTAIERSQPREEDEPEW